VTFFNNDRICFLIYLRYVTIPTLETISHFRSRDKAGKVGQRIDGVIPLGAQLLDGNVMNGVHLSSTRGRLRWPFRRLRREEG
jgi:hypothetical protein